MRKLFIRYNSFFVILLLGVALMLPFFAKEVGATELPTIILDGSVGVSDLRSKVNKASNEIGKFDYMSYKSGDNNTTVVKVNTAVYNTLDSTQKRQLMSKVLDEIENSNLQSKEKTRLYNFVSKQDTSTSAVVRQLSENVNADYIRAWVWFKPFSGGISTLLGFITLAISALLTLSTLIDISWLIIPLVQMLGSKTTGEKPKWISNEAWTSQRDAERDGNVYRNSLALYFSRKTKSWLVLFICLLYLLNGQIFDLIGWIMDTISTIIFG